MQIINLTVAQRKVRGSKRARALRRAGKIPAVLYGHGMEPVSLEVPRGTLLSTLHTKSGTNVIVKLQLEGVKLKESTCLIKDLQHNPVTDQIDHVDFTVISMTEKIQVNIPVEIIHGDEAPGIKEGGVLDVVHHEIKVECLPTQIPEAVVVDIKALKINTSIHVSELNLPEGVACLLDAAEVVVAIHAVKEEIVEEVVEAGATEPEVMEKGKKPAEGEAAAAEGAKKAEVKKPEMKKPETKKPEAKK